MTDSGSSKFVKTSDGSWLRVNNILEFAVIERDLTDEDGNSLDRYCIRITKIYNNNCFHKTLEIKPNQECWSREEWQEYLDEFMYDQGLTNGKE